MSRSNRCHSHAAGRESRRFGTQEQAVALLIYQQMYPEHRTWLLKSALRGGECVWWRGILRKGNGLCHGTSGSAYALLELFRTTGDSLWLRRANAFAQVTSFYLTDLAYATKMRKLQ